MYRNLYDTDCTTWSPEGRVYQIEYASESVKQGSCGVGVKSNTNVVVCGLRRTINSLATHNDKVVKIDDYIGCTFSGITADAKCLIDAMRSSALTHRITFEESPSVEKIVTTVQSRAQKLTQNSSKRPFGVGMLIAGASPESNETFLFETSPTGDYFDYKCTAFGCRSQSSNSYLESVMDTLPPMNSEELIQIALNALQKSLPSEQSLTRENCHVGVLGVALPWKVLTENDLRPYLEKLPKRDEEGLLADPPAEDIEE